MENDGDLFDWDNSHEGAYIFHWAGRGTIGKGGEAALMRSAMDDMYRINKLKGLKT